MQQPRLPLELFRSIILDAASDSIAANAALILTCRLFQQEAERLLYECIDTSVVWSPARFPHIAQSDDLWKHFYWKKYSALLITLQNNQRLAGHVRTIISHDEPDHSTYKHFRFLLGAFGQLPNLKALIFEDGHGDFRSVGRSMWGAKFQLERFTWSRRFEHIHEEMEFLTILLPMLRGQPSIRSLRIWEWPDIGIVDQELPLSKNILPNLTILQATISACLAFLPGRNVRALSLSVDTEKPSFSPDEIRLIAPALGGLERLVLRPDIDRETVHSVLTYTTSLRYLHLVGVRSGDEASVAQISTLEHIKLSRDPSLVQIGCSDSTALSFVDNQARYLDDIFGALDHLQMIDVDDRDIGFNRYLRGRIQHPEHISEDIFTDDGRVHH